MRRLWEHQGGNVAILFGLALVPLLALGGGTVDLANRANIRDELQAAADTAAIAAAKVVQAGRLDVDVDDEELNAKATAEAEKVFRAVLGERRSDIHIDVSVEGRTVNVTGDFSVPTSFLNIIGIEALNANVATEVSIPNPVLMEVALVLDYSGSMGDNDKYVRMTSAAQDFIRRVEEEGEPGSTIGIVPFSEYVLAGVSSSYVRGASGAKDPAAPEVSQTSGNGYCLLNRDYPYSATDVPPSALPASQWKEGTSGSCSQYHSKNLKVRDLTDDFDALIQAFNKMEPVGLTNISLGIEMGWHLLSPDQPYDTARSYSDTKMEKVLILLTDGMQTVPAMGPSETSTQAADEVTAEICESAKDLGIRIFSVAYDVSDTYVHQLLFGCASNTESYFDARSVSDISGVFEQIFSQIMESVWVSE